MKGRVQESRSKIAKWPAGVKALNRESCSEEVAVSGGRIEIKIVLETQCLQADMIAVSQLMDQDESVN